MSKQTPSAPTESTIGPCPREWSGCAMVLDKLPVPGRPTFWIIVGQGPIALAEGAGWGLFGHFTLFYHFSPLSSSLWETARYRLKYCLKGPLNQKQSINQSNPCPTVSQVSRTPWYWKFTKHLRTTRPPPTVFEPLKFYCRLSLQRTIRAHTSFFIIYWPK